VDSEQVWEEVVLRGNAVCGAGKNYLSGQRSIIVADLCHTLNQVRFPFRGGEVAEEIYLCPGLTMRTRVAPFCLWEMVEADPWVMVMVCHAVEELAQEICELCCCCYY